MSTGELRRSLKNSTPLQRCSTLIVWPEDSELRATIRRQNANRLLILVAVCTLLFSSRVMLGQATQSAPAARASSRTISDEEIQIMRADVRANWKKLTAANMTLTPDEAAKFWPLYDQYIQETIKVEDVRWALIKEYAAKPQHNVGPTRAGLHDEIGGC